MQGHNLTANQAFFGWYGSSAVTVNDLGKVTVSDLYVGNGTALTLHGGDVVNSLINLSDNSVLTVQQVNGTGLTLNGTSLSSLTIDPSSMDLIFTLDTSTNWDFRWQDPANGGNWVSTIDSMIASGQIQITAPDGYSVVDQGGYTYIMGGVASVPEPSSLVLAGIAAGGIVLGTEWRRRRRGR
jgi:PEP-CTERM motif